MHLRIKSCCTEPEVGIEARVCRLLVDMNPRNVSKEFLVEGLDVLVMSDMRIENGHLAAADTSAYIGHTVVVADGSMLIVRICIAGLGGIPHNLVSLFRIAANEGAASGSGNHLVAVE